ncbi:guanylate kinase [Helicobacter didelphidarum]|uniref:Guanylate kinase n=1 Tax=Helicobacter didelphidarum TaxID=2040648 RepID=A0A3D8ISU6_9HELI|nr:guanylate kinase [Helicobacter didelphidarum]
MHSKDYNILIISGPSGAGKSTLSRFLQEHIPNLYFSISTTTRPKRSGEQDGKDYFFVSHNDFMLGIESGKFLEYEEVHGNFYGTGIAQFEEAIRENKFILCDVDVKGHDSIKTHYPHSKSVFITTKELQTLKARLEMRNADNEETIHKRLLNALDELKHADSFDYLLINDTIKDSKEAILHIAKSMFLLNSKSKIENLLIQYYI